METDVSADIALTTSNEVSAVMLLPSYFRQYRTLCSSSLRNLIHNDMGSVTVVGVQSMRVSGTAVDIRGVRGYRRARNVIFSRCAMASHLVLTLVYSTPVTPPRSSVSLTIVTSVCGSLQLTLQGQGAGAKAARIADAHKHGVLIERTAFACARMSVPYGCHPLHH
jgi:hypothetical protein